MIYQQRNELFETDDISETIVAMRHGVIAEIFRSHVPEVGWKSSGTWPVWKTLASSLLIEAPVAEWFKNEPTLSDDGSSPASSGRRRKLRRQVELVGAETFHQFERNVMPQSLDTHWREHLAALDHLRQGHPTCAVTPRRTQAGIQAEAFQLFEALLDSVRREVTRVVTGAHHLPRGSPGSRAPSDVQNVKYQRRLRRGPGRRAAGRAGGQQPSRPALVGRNDPLSLRQRQEAQSVTGNCPGAGSPCRR